MSEQQPGGPARPPESVASLTVDDLADLHTDLSTGTYDAATTTRLRALVAADQQAAAVFRALDSTVDSLSLLPPLTMPQAYVSRLDAALAAEAAGGSGGAGHAPTRVLAVDGFAAMLAPGESRPAPGGLPHLTPDATTRRTTPGPRSGPSGVVDPLAPTVRVPPPPRRVPLIPPVLPGSDRLRSVPDAGGPGAPTGPTGASSPAELPDGVTSLDARRARRRRTWIGAGVGIAAAAAAIAVFSAIGLNNKQDGSGQAAGPVTPPAATVSQQPILTPSGPLGVQPPTTGGGLQAFVIQPGEFGEALAVLEGRGQAGGDSSFDAPTFAACLQANGIADDADLLGVSDVTYEGRDAVAIAIAVPGEPTKARVLVVGTGCGTSAAADLLADETVTR